MDEQARKFSAKTIAGAMRKVKDELGPEAVLLSRYTENGMVHLIAAPFSPEPETIENKEKISLFEPQQLNYFSPQYPIAEKFSYTCLFSPLSETSRLKKQSVEITNMLKSEIDSLKEFIQFQLSKSGEQNIFSSNSHYQNLVNKLSFQGYSENVIKSVLSGLPSNISLEQAVDFVIFNFLKKLKFNSKIMGSDKKIKAFIGPSGVGKTHLIAKLMLHSTKNNIENKFSFIFLNHSNLKVLEESKIYGRIFNAPSYYAESLDELEKFYKYANKKEHVILDTPAYDFNCPDNNFHIKFLQNNSDKIDITLVVCPHVKASSLDKYLSLYSGFQFNGVCVTKLDESTEYSEILDYIIQKNIPLRFLSAGQDFSSGLILADKKYFKKYFLESLLINKDEKKEFFSHG